MIFGRADNSLIVCYCYCLPFGDAQLGSINEWNNCWVWKVK